MASDIIRSRKDFHRVLDETLAMAHARVAETPAFGVYRAIVQQLELVKAWTAGNERPTDAQRSAITVGLIALRELEPVATAADQAFITNLHELNYYFDNWPANPDVAAEG